MEETVLQMSTLPQTQVKEFVSACHGDPDQVKLLLAETPELLEARLLEWDETGLEAAAHMGNREIARYMLEEGASYMIFAAAMLGDRQGVERFLSADPELVNANGVHGISLLYHAVLSGEVELVEMLRSRGNDQDVSQVLPAAVAKGHLEMAAWLLGQGADPRSTSPAGQSALEIARRTEHPEMVALLSGE